MTYCISDIHNDYSNFVKLLKKINFVPESDRLYVLGDVFDRGAEPLELYSLLRDCSDFTTVIMGNHDDWFADFLYAYLEGLRNDYFDVTFELIRNKMSAQELLELANWIKGQPLYVRADIDGEDFLLAHGQTFKNMEQVSRRDILMGEQLDFNYLMNGIQGVSSVIGHTPTDVIRKWVGHDECCPNTVWTNKKANVYCIDCGNGFRKYESAPGSRLAALCLETKETFYV